MIDRGHGLLLRRQAEVLWLTRSSLCHEPRPVSAAELAIMRRIDERHLDDPFAGSRMMRDLLRGKGGAIGRGQVGAMMRRMGIEALFRRPNTSKPAPGHKTYPYPLHSPDRPCEHMACPVCECFGEAGLVSLRQRIRPQGIASAKMEIRAFWSS